MGEDIRFRRRRVALRNGLICLCSSSRPLAGIGTLMRCLGSVVEAELAVVLSTRRLSHLMDGITYLPFTAFALEGKQI